MADVENPSLAKEESNLDVEGEENGTSINGRGGPGCAKPWLVAQRGLQRRACCLAQPAAPRSNRIGLGWRLGARASSCAGIGGRCSAPP